VTREPPTVASALRITVASALRPCPREPDVSRALQLGPDAALEQHLAACATCRASWDGYQAAIGLARELPVELPSPARSDEVRASLLAAAESGQAGPICTRTAHLRWPAVGVAAAAAMVWIARGHVHDARPRSHAVVHASTGAAFVIASAPPDETLRLRGGTVEVQVDPLGPGERFRVVTGDGEVEVRGTAFAVSAADDRLADVSVAHGRVEIRPRDGAPALLGPGQTWRAERAAVRPSAPAAPPVVTPPIEPAAAAPQAPPRRAVHQSARFVAVAEPPASATARSGPTPQEALYDDAWDAMRAGDFAKAAARFASVVGAAPRGPLADEGAFWRAVATARAGQAAPAIDLFHEMLERYPASARRGEATAMLGWLLIDAGRRDEARAQFRAADRDPSDRVRASARRGLEAIDR
jgi:TolA-binding protein